jgi:uncharacterized protein YyaL (SSP411 family)
MPPPDGGPEYNRLIHEKSPYLLQHAANPVDWYPWGDEAFRRAQKEDKPVFLSVGYSTCHWCHVMERESFENDEIAAVLSEHFIPIKVDREERPDIDEIYMNATQFLTGSGGWPNSVWLTPDGRPWYAGTYFPPEDRYGRPGFKTLLLRLSEIWKSRRQDVETQADRLVEAMRMASSGEEAGDGDELGRDLVADALKDLRRNLDYRHGGFGSAPKFPPHGSLRLLLSELRRSLDDELLDMIVKTLDGMALGGVRDHVGGGFHRYSTDERWFLPHFEKMLYDNAQLAWAYSEAYSITGEGKFRRVAVDVIEWVLRDMRSPGGAFYSALDADSEGEEGKFYVWTREEILDVLGDEEGDLFCRIYGVEDDGNFREEATGRKSGANILHLERPIALYAKVEEVPEADLRSRLEKSREVLLAVRSERVWPHLDDKVLAGWNGLMIGALAHAGRTLDRPDYVEAAEKAVGFILDEMMGGGRLLRTWREGEAKISAYLDDYAFLAWGLLELHEATGDERWLTEARRLADALLDRFRDPGEGGFFFTPEGQQDLLYRSKDPYDRAIPSGNGMATRVLLRLAGLTGDERYREAARETLEAFLGIMHRVPRATETLILAAAEYLEHAPAPNPGREPAGVEPDATARTKPVTVDAFVSRLSPSAGETFRVALRVSVDDGWHINSNAPKKEHLVPTAVLPAEKGPYEPYDLRYPPGEERTLGFSDEKLSVYDGTIWVEARMKVKEEKGMKKQALRFKLRFQACNDRFCLPPETVVVEVPFRNPPGEEGGQTRHPEVFEALSSAGS